jgi:hypothetical protein
VAGAVQSLCTPASSPVFALGSVAYKAFRTGSWVWSLFLIQPAVWSCFFASDRRAIMSLGPWGIFSCPRISLLRSSLQRLDDSPRRASSAGTRESCFSFLHLSHLLFDFSLFLERDGTVAGENEYLKPGPLTCFGMVMGLCASMRVRALTTSRRG